jgi:hypothetical protein
MGRKNKNVRTKPQHARGKARKQGLHKNMDSPEQQKASAWLIGRQEVDRRAA